jgi:hypothetical protein
MFLLPPTQEVFMGESLGSGSFCVCMYVTWLIKGQTYAAVEAIWPNSPGPWEAGA